MLTNKKIETLNKLKIGDENMLFNIYGKEIKCVYHKTDFYRMKRNIPTDDMAKLKEKLNILIKKAYDDINEDKNILTSSWIPGKDWTGTVYESIYKNGAGSDFGLAAKLFGLVLMETFIEQKDDWVFMKADNDQISGSYYFKKKF